MLKRQRGNCFDYAILLCSLLVGVGYDAYCVCGYATQEVTQHNLTRKMCPLLTEREETKEEKEDEMREKYIVRPPRDLSSQFEKRMADKEMAQVEEERKKKVEEEEAKRAVRNRTIAVTVFPRSDAAGTNFFILLEPAATIPGRRQHTSTWQHVQN